MSVLFLVATKAEATTELDNYCQQNSRLCQLAQVLTEAGQITPSWLGSVLEPAEPVMAVVVSDELKEGL